MQFFVLKNMMVLPISVLELDEFKKDTIPKITGEEFVRTLDRITSNKDFTNWIPLNGSAHGNLRVIMDTTIRE